MIPSVITQERTIQFEKLQLAESHKADDCVVVIDVLRAFTTAAVAFDKGAKDIILVDTIERARHINNIFKDSLLMGEDEGKPLQGFHFSNSPDEMAHADTDLTGKTVIQRTSSGTQGVVKSINAKTLLTGSFVVADAIIERIRQLAPGKVSFILTGPEGDNDEDEALADYLQDKLQDRPVTQEPYLQRVRDSKNGKKFASGLHAHLPKKDLEYACQLDLFTFAMEVHRKEIQGVGECLVMTKLPIKC